MWMILQVCNAKGHRKNAWLCQFLPLQMRIYWNVFVCTSGTSTTISRCSEKVMGTCILLMIRTRSICQFNHTAATKTLRNFTVTYVPNYNMQQICWGAAAPPGESKGLWPPAKRHRWASHVWRSACVPAASSQRCPPASSVKRARLLSPDTPTSCAPALQ